MFKLQSNPCFNFRVINGQVSSTKITPSTCTICIFRCTVYGKYTIIFCDGDTSSNIIDGNFSQKQEERNATK